MAVRKVQKIVLGRAGAIVGISTTILLLILTLRCWTQTSVKNRGGGSPCPKTKRNNVEPWHPQTKSETTKAITCFLFVIVFTGPEGAERRKAVRETWTKLTDPAYKVVVNFVVGTEGLSQKLSQNLDFERKQNNDLIILPNHKESYSKLTEKLLKTIVWVNSNVESQFFMKADDDSFVRLDKLSKDLNAKSHLGRLYWGFFRGDSNVKKRGPWAEEKWILCDHYLPYALGGGYVISTDLVHYIASIASMVRFYNSEDVSLGTWLAPVRLNRIHDVRFDTEYKSRGCNNKHVVSHKQSIQDMFDKYDELKTNNKLCKEETQERLSFDYNWAVKPSKCCERQENIP